MEVSSHALELHRADAIHWAVAVFTNLTQDHLDFHPTMEDYFAAKRRLFAAAPRARVANVDDPYGRRLAEEFPDTVTVGIDSEDASLRATGLRTGLRGSRFDAGGRQWHTTLPGRFNVLNALCAIAAARALGVGDDAIAAALPAAARAPGRFEPVDAGQDFAVLVDYAHTPDSLENVLTAARDARARARRSRSSAAAATATAASARRWGRSARGWPTWRSSPPTTRARRIRDAIIDEILAGVPAGTSAHVDVIEDRRAAIGAAVARARRRATSS